MSVKLSLGDAAEVKLVPKAKHVTPHIVLHQDKGDAVIVTENDFVLANGYDDANGWWSHGNYFKTLADASEAFELKHTKDDLIAEHGTELAGLSRAKLLDVFVAYNAYIQTAIEAQLFESGWRPVCMDEFFACEYANVWRGAEDKACAFDYMFDEGNSVDFEAEVDESVFEAVFEAASEQTEVVDGVTWYLKYETNGDLLFAYAPDDYGMGVLNVSERDGLWTARVAGTNDVIGEPTSSFHEAAEVAVAYAHAYVGLADRLGIEWIRDVEPGVSGMMNGAYAGQGCGDKQVATEDIAAER